MNLNDWIQVGVFESIFEGWHETPQIYILGAALLFWAFIRIRRRFQTIRVFRTEEGSVEVSKRALLGVVYNACTSVGTLSRPSVELIQKGGKIHILVKVVLKSGEHLTNLSVQIQSAIRDGLKDCLGIENIGRINVLMRGFKAEPKTFSSSEIRAEEASEKEEEQE